MRVKLKNIIPIATICKELESINKEDLISLTEGKWSQHFSIISGNFHVINNTVQEVITQSKQNFKDELVKKLKENESIQVSEILEQAEITGVSSKEVIKEIVGGSSGDLIYNSQEDETQDFISAP